MNILFRILFVAMMALESHAIATIMIKAGETSKTYSGTSILSAGVFAAADAAGYWIIEVDSPESSTFRIYTKPSANYLNEKCDYYLAAVDGGTTLFAIPASEGVLEFFPDSPTVFRFDTLRIALSKHITKYTQFTSKGQGTGDCYVTLTHDDTGAGLGNDVEAVRFNAQSWFGVSLAKIEATRFTVAITPHELYLNPVTQPQASHRGDALEKIESVWWRDELQPSSSKSEQLIVYRLHADFNLPVPLLVWYYGVRALSSDMRPDFVITGVTINGSKALKSGGDTLKAEVTIKNQGSEYGNLNAIEWGLANANVSTVNNLTLFVAPGAITKVQIEGSVNSGPGTYALNLKLNPGGPSDGSNERDYGNNTVQKTFVVMGPDYTVSAITFSPPAPLSPGQRFSAKVTIKNVGSETGPSFYGNSLAVWTDRPAEPATGEISGAVIGDWNYMKVNASQTVTFDNLKAPDAPGTYTFRAFADCYDVVAEQRNDNNQKAMTYTVNGPDYIVDTIRLIPAKPLAGQSFDAEVVIKNQGKGSGPGIGPGMIHAWVHRPDAPAVGDTEGGVTLPAQTAAIPDIGAGRSQKVVFRSLTAPVTPGSYTFRVFVDSAGDIAETAENNNQRTVSYTVYQGAGVPVPTGPQGKQFGASQTYAWSAASFASSYDLLIEYLNAGTGVWLTFKSLPGLKVTTTTLTGHKEGFSYRWRVRANNANGAGAWSDAMAFTVAVTPIVPLPGAPEGYEPAGTVTDSTPRF